MPEDVEKSKDRDTKGVSVYMPKDFHAEVIKIVKREGYMNVSDYMRDAARRLNQFYQTRYHSQIIDYLLKTGSLQAADIHEAIQFIVTHEP